MKTTQLSFRHRKWILRAHQKFWITYNDKDLGNNYHYDYYNFLRYYTIDKLQN